MGGGLSVISEHSTGSTFTLHLQIAKGEETIRGTLLLPRLHRNPMNGHILFVEDEEELCSLGDRLRSEGYVVDIACTDIPRFEKPRSPFDLIVLRLTSLPYRNPFDLVHTTYVVPALRSYPLLTRA